MKHLIRLSAIVGFLLLAIACPASGQSPDPARPSRFEPDPGPVDDAVTLDDGRQLWFVEMAGPPVVDRGNRVSIRAEQDAFRASASQRGVAFTERRTFQDLWNGFSIAVRPADLDELRTLSTVAALYPVVAIEPPDTEPATEPELLSALAMTGADVAQGSLGLSGAGVKVGVIDTGIDYDHPDLGGDGVSRANSPMFPNARVVAGWDFVGDAFTGPGAVPAPDPYPDDCGGHGTHVAGIVGASGGVTGVAPRVMIGAYRVFGCGGSTTADIVIAAMERALADGMQVVNLSLGSDRQWPSYPTAAAASRLVNRGVVVCASIGNAGTTGLWAGSAPGVGHKVIGVASFQNTMINLNAITVSPDDRALPYNIAIAAPTAPPPPPLSGTFPIVRTGPVDSGLDGCGQLPPGSLAGRVALIRRGVCTFYTKAWNAQNAGAVAVVIYNNVAGTLIPNVTSTTPLSPPITIPVLGITRDDGLVLEDRLAAGPVSVSWGGVFTIANPGGGMADGFSSFGPGPDLTLKADLGAPGGFIRSTFPLERGKYANISGTSMASPHVAGAVALLLEARPHTPANAVRSILQNTARPATRRDAIDVVPRQGAGLLRIDDAILATTRIVPGKLELGESQFGPVRKTLSIANQGAVGVRYTLGHDDAQSTGPNTFLPDLLPSASAVSFSVNPVLVPAGATANVDVTVAPDPALPDRSLFGGYITATPDDGGIELRVPFLGFKGDYQSIPVLVPTTANPPLPRLTKWTGTTFAPQPNGASYTLVGDDVPYIEYHLDHPVEIVRFEIADAATGRSWHRALNERGIGRNTGPATFYRTPWTGRTMRGRHIVTVPNGVYRLTLSIKKALGDDDNPAHWESWVSPPITLARPGVAVEPMGQTAPGVGEALRALALAPAMPNPFGDDVVFRFGLPESGPVSLEVFDLLGRRLRAWTWSELPAGEHDVRWDGRIETGGRAPAGVVLLRLTAMGKTLTRKVARLP